MRYNIEFNKRQDDQLKELKERIGAKSKAEVIRRALEVLTVIVNRPNCGEILLGIVSSLPPLEKSSGAK